MFVFLAIVNEVLKNFFDSLKKDLGGKGFEMALIIALNAWAGALLLFWLLATGQFQMPIDPLFYAYWLVLTFLTEISFALFLRGMLKTTFFAATSLSNISFVMTALYATFLLHEHYTLLQMAAIFLAGIGTVLFFKKSSSKNHFSENKGLWLILFSLVLTPLEYIFYLERSLSL